MNSPQALLEENQPGLTELSFNDIESVILANPEPSKNILIGLERYFRVTTRNLIASNSDRQTLLQFSELLASILSYDIQTYLQTMAERFDLRFKPYKDIIDDHIAFLGAFNLESTLKKTHVQRILQYLNKHSSGIAQSQLMKDLNLSKSYTTNLLSELQGFNCIAKKRIGRENQVQLTDYGSSVLTQYNENLLLPYDSLVAAATALNSSIPVRLSMQSHDGEILNYIHSNPPMFFSERFDRGKPEAHEFRLEAGHTVSIQTKTESDETVVITIKGFSANRNIIQKENSSVVITQQKE